MTRSGLAAVIGLTVLLIIGCGEDEATGPPPTGSIEVSLSVTGSVPDADGFVVTIDGGHGDTLLSGGSLRVTGLAAGAHTVTISDVAPNCNVEGETTRAVTVPAEDTFFVPFAADCPTPFYDHIAFESYRDGPSDLWVMGSDGSNPVRLTTDDEADWQPSWSPNATRIAFTHGGYREPGNIYVMDGDGSNLVNLTNHGARDGTPVWSPDGSRIAFSTNRDGNWEVYVMDGDGSNPINLTNHGSRDESPAWSPDGSRIAFSSARDGNAEIYLMHADGSDPVNITNDPSDDRAPAWSPDGSRIAFASYRAGSQEVFVVNPDGSGLRQVSRLEHGFAPTWSPDGLRIAYQGYCGSRDCGTDILVATPDGSGWTNLTNHGGYDGSPGWSPDRP